MTVSSKKNTFFTWMLYVGFINLGIVSTHAQNQERLLRDALQALEKVTSFFAEDYSSINVDGLFGMRLGQGSINQTLTDCSNPRFRCPRQMVMRLQGLNAWIETIAAKAMPYLEARDKQYYDHFLYTFNAPYLVRYRVELLGASVSEAGRNSDYNEDIGDDCYSRLFGTYVDPRTERKSPQCTITDECWDLMTQTGQSGYSITHQLLYFVLGEKIGCMDEMEVLLKRSGTISLREHERTQCGHIFAETMQESEDGKVPAHLQDLFSEQSLLCGILGFADFYTEKWLRMLLSWQGPNGCFADKMTVEEKIHEYTKQLQVARNHAVHHGHANSGTGHGIEEERLLSRMQAEARYIEQSPATGRKLLRETVMKDGCLAHKSGLGFGLLGGYIRYYVNILYGPSHLTKRLLPPRPVV